MALEHDYKRAAELDARARRLAHLHRRELFTESGSAHVRAARRISRLIGKASEAERRARWG